MYRYWRRSSSVAFVRSSGRKGGVSARARNSSRDATTSISPVGISRFTCAAPRGATSPSISTTSSVRASPAACTASAPERALSNRTCTTPLRSRSVRKMSSPRSRRRPTHPRRRTRRPASCPVSFPAGSRSRVKCSSQRRDGGRAPRTGYGLLLPGREPLDGYRVWASLALTDEHDEHRIRDRFPAKRPHQRDWWPAPFPSLSRGRRGRPRRSPPGARSVPRSRSATRFGTSSAP